MATALCQICESDEQIGYATKVSYVCPECSAALRQYMLPSVCAANQVRRDRKAEKATE